MINAMHFAFNVDSRPHSFNGYENERKLQNPPECQAVHSSSQFAALIFRVVEIGN